MSLCLPHLGIADSYWDQIPPNINKQRNSWRPLPYIPHLPAAHAHQSVFLLGRQTTCQLSIPPDYRKINQKQRNYDHIQTNQQILEHLKISMDTDRTQDKLNLSFYGRKKAGVLEAGKENTFENADSERLLFSVYIRLRMHGEECNNDFHCSVTMLFLIFVF